MTLEKSSMFLLIAGVFATCLACGPDTSPRAPGSKPNSIDGTAPGADDPSNPTNPASPELPGGADPGSSNPGNLPPTAEEKAQQAQLELLHEILPACGVTNPDQFKTEKLGDQSIDSAPWQRSGTGGLLGLQEYNYSLRGAFSYDGTFERIVNSATIGVISSNSSLGKDRGEAESRSRSGALTAAIFPLEQRHTLKNSAPIWDDIYCTAQAASRLTNTLGGKRTVTEFSPPLPYWISPKADPFRYTSELGTGKVWDQFTATVIESNDNGLTSGTIMRGSARIDAVPASASILNRTGAVVSIVADVAFKVTYNVESGTRNAAIGLPSSITFYIDQKNKRFKAVVFTTAGEDSLTISQVAD